MRPCEKLSSRQRKATPPLFADYLIGRVKSMFGVEAVAVLWVARDSVYWSFWPEVELWGVGRDANSYAGPHPIIAHPPCGPWGNFKWKCFRDKKADGVKAIELVHRWGGVIEHPVGSTLFADHGRPGAAIERVNQADYGHQALKPTLLYFVKEREA
jgi:hypothetical protein